MRQVQNWVVGFLPVHPVQCKNTRAGQFVENHRAGLVDRRQLCGVTKQEQGREYFLQVGKLLVIQHRGFIDKADVQRLFASLPAGDEIGPPQAGRGQRAGYRLVGGIERRRPLQRQVGQTFDFGAFAIACQPLRDALEFRVIDRRVQDPVNCRGRNPV